MTNPTSEPSPQRRRSITKLQRQSAAGADLIALCQTVTEDGSIADEEVAALREWLVDHAATDLPAHTYLVETVERIVADGKVTVDERRALYQAIETVLPPDLRTPARSRRREREQAAADQVRPSKVAPAQGSARRAARARAPAGAQPIVWWALVAVLALIVGRLLLGN